MPRDTDPPPPSEPTLVPGAPDLAIPAGKAALHVAGAFVDLLEAVHRAQAIAMAAARAADLKSAPGPYPPRGENTDP